MSNIQSFYSSPDTKVSNISISHLSQLINHLKFSYLYCLISKHDIYFLEGTAGPFG